MARGRKSTKAQKLPRNLRQPSLLSADTLLDIKFQDWLEKHPDVYVHFVRLALRLKRAGRGHYGAKAIIEYLRFQSALDTRGPEEPYKLSNSYTSRLARKAMEEQEELAGFFTTHKLTA
jgi:hypothetical protein